MRWLKLNCRQWRYTRRVAAGLLALCLSKAHGRSFYYDAPTDELFLHQVRLSKGLEEEWCFEKPALLPAAIPVQPIGEDDLDDVDSLEESPQGPSETNAAVVLPHSPIRIAEPPSDARVAPDVVEPAQRDEQEVPAAPQVVEAPTPVENSTELGPSVLPLPQNEVERLILHFVQGQQLSPDILTSLLYPVFTTQSALQALSAIDGFLQQLEASKHFGEEVAGQPYVGVVGRLFSEHFCLLPLTTIECAHVGVDTRLDEDLHGTNFLAEIEYMETKFQRAGWVLCKLYEAHLVSEGVCHQLMFRWVKDYAHMFLDTPPYIRRNRGVRFFYDVKVLVKAAEASVPTHEALSVKQMLLTLAATATHLAVVTEALDTFTSVEYRALWTADITAFVLDHYAALLSFYEEADNTSSFKELLSAYAFLLKFQNVSTDSSLEAAKVFLNGCVVIKNKVANMALLQFELDATRKNLISAILNHSFTPRERAALNAFIQKAKRVDVLARAGAHDVIEDPEGCGGIKVNRLKLEEVRRLVDEGMLYLFCKHVTDALLLSSWHEADFEAKKDYVEELIHHTGLVLTRDQYFQAKDFLQRLHATGPFVCYSKSSHQAVEKALRRLVVAHSQRPC